MKEEIAKLWIDALRSGDYKQTKSALCKEYSDGCAFCCLGVLCDIYTKHGDKTCEVFTSESLEYEKNSNKPYKSRFFNGHASVLPEDVVLWAGLKSGTPFVKNNTRGLHSEKDLIEIITLNDTLNRSFTELANEIELQFRNM